MKPRALKNIYTILADDVPVAALEATGVEARELLKERWFLLELAALEVDGEPIYKAAPGCGPDLLPKRSGPFTKRDARRGRCG